MNRHEQVDQLLAGFALGGLDERAAAMVRRHLKDCDACAANLASMADVVGALPLSVDLAQPSPALRERIVAIPQSRRRPLPVLPRLPRPLVRVPFRGQPLRWSWAAVAAIAVALVAWNVALQRQLNQVNATVAQLHGQTLRATLVGQGGSQAGSVSYFAPDRVALVSLRGLAVPASDREYELWLIPAGGSPLPVGTFLPESDGAKLLVVTRVVNHGDVLAVTVEPRGVAHTAPTTTPFITGRVT